MISARTCRTGTPMPTGSEETGSDTEWARPGPRAKPGRRSARRHCPAGRQPRRECRDGRSVGGVVHLCYGLRLLGRRSGGRLEVRGRDRAVVDGTSLLGALEQPVCDTLLKGVPHDGDLRGALGVGLRQGRSHLGGGLRLPLVREVSGDQFAPRRLGGTLGSGCLGGGGLSGGSLLSGPRPGLRCASGLPGRCPALGRRAAGTETEALRALFLRGAGFSAVPSTSCILTRICSPSSSWMSSSCRRVSSARARSCSLRFAARSSVIRCA